MESPHPYPSGQRIVRQTIMFEDVDAISLTFDGRCSTKDSNDALILYADTQLNKRLPFGPYSGNSSDGNTTWPRRGTIVIPGNLVVFHFSARSHPGHHQSSMDRRRWGFRCVARGLRLQALPGLLQLQQDVASAATYLTGILIHGETVLPDEHMLERWFCLGFACNGLESSAHRSSSVV